MNFLTSQAVSVIVRAMKQRMRKCAGHVAGVGIIIRNSYQILVGKPEWEEATLNESLRVWNIK
jgi:hypothetical protein